MTLSWDDLAAAIDADDVDAVEKLLLATTEKDRRSCWPQVEALTAHSEERQRRRRDRGEGGLLLAIAGTAPNAGKLAATYWLAWPREDLHRRATALLVVRSPSWLAGLGRALLADEWGPNWRLVRELLRAGAIPEPEDREEYLRQMVLRRDKHAKTLRDLLLDDPALLDREVYEMFEHEACGVVLANHDHYVAHSWDHQKRRSVPSTERDPHAESWGQVLADLAAEGRLDRGRLLDLALAALVRDVTWSRKTWYAGFLDLLSPTVDEMADRRGSYMALLAAGDGPSVGLGQAAVETLLAGDRLRPDELLPVADAPLLRKEKAVALRQLKLLDGLAAEPAWAPDAVTAMATAFGHPRPDVQERALRLIGPRLADLPDDMVDQLRDAASACAPSLAAMVAAVFGTTTTIATAEPCWTPPPAPVLPPPLTEDPDLVEAAVALMAGERDPLLFDRVAEGLLARVSREPAELGTALAPAVAAARKAIRSFDVQRASVAGAVLLAAGERAGGQMIDVTRPVVPRAPNPLARRFEELLARLDARRSGPWLSTPTAPDGRLDPAQLARREHELGPIDDQLVAADRAIARTRAGLADGMAALPDWLAPTTYCTEYRRVLGADGAAVLEPAFWLTWGVRGPLTTHWPVIWPHWPGHAVAYVLPLLRKEVEHEPTSFEPSVTVPLLAWLTQPTIEVGDWTGAALAFALGSRVALHRAAAVDALLVQHHGGRLGNVPVVACVLAAGEAGVVKLGRVAQCLADLLPAAPALTRDLALALLPALIEGGHKEAHRFLTVAADAVATAGTVELPAAVIEASGRKGSSKLVTEARRVVLAAGSSK